VQYSDEEAVVSIPEGDLMEGSLRRAKLKLVQAWIEIHQDELMVDWEPAVNGLQVFKIEPLKWRGRKMNKVTAVKANDDFSLDLSFTDGSVRRFDTKPYLEYEVFRELKDLNYFRKVDLAFGTVRWPNEQDISPETLYIESLPVSDNGNWSCRAS
jgi:hypothetical protein